MEIAHSKPMLTALDRDAIDRQLAGAMIAKGDATRALEQAIRARLGLPFALATASGTDALAAALRAVGVERDDEVVLPTYVCEAVWVAIRAVGATPVLCDVELDRCASARTIQPVISPRTRALVVVHTFGAVADVTSISALGRPVVEDCCQAFGASRNGRLAGTLGDACVLSFHATKLLTTGEGGMALVRHEDAGHRLEAVRRERRSPLADLQAALGLSQLQQYDSFVTRRRQIADRYFAELRDLAIELPSDVADRSVFFRFAVRSTQPFESVRDAFAADGIHVRRGVDALLHRRFAAAQPFPNADLLFDQTVSLPIYPAMSDADVSRVVESARRVFGRR